MTITKEDLLQAGFKEEKNAQGQDVLVKKQDVSTLPYAGDHVIDGDVIREEMIAVTTVLDGQVTLTIPEGDYVEGPVSLATEEGVALIKDAMDPPAPRPRFR